jgi:hypothetical protein
MVCSPAAGVSFCGKKCGEHGISSQLAILSSHPLTALSCDLAVSISCPRREYCTFKQFASRRIEKVITGAGQLALCEAPKPCEGQYEDDLKHGQGIFKWPDGRAWEGEWRDGKQHGEGVYSAASGEKRKGKRSLLCKSCF